MDTPILGGMSFFKENDIAIRPAYGEIIIDGTDVIKYDHSQSSTVASRYRKISHYTIQPSVRNVILPGESIKVPVPAILAREAEVAIEPRHDSVANRNQLKHPWPSPGVATVEDGKISY